MADRTRPRLGLLPMYIKLYDDVLPDARTRLEEFAEVIVREFEERGLDVQTAQVCRLQAEFSEAVKNFEEAGVDAIVTLHLAYSPSLESIEALASTRLPLIVLDTTQTYEFGPGQNPDEIMYNHGIHGVQDMCNLLIRHGKPFYIEVGHWEKSDVLDRVEGWVRAAHLAGHMRSARVGSIGGAFAGMGDFAVTDDVLEAMGVQVVPADLSELASLVPPVDDPGVESETASDLSSFACDGLDTGALKKSVRAGLAVRRWIEKEKLTAWTMNFGAIDRTSGLPTLPFLEASKGMARGIGYAGEGDVLTAALVGALASVYPETTFTEMFCPDWAGETIFLSHMGELNLDLVAGKAELLEKILPWCNIDSPALAVGRFKAGNAVFVNLAPGPCGSFSLILAPVEVIGDGRENMPGTVRGWIKPELPVSDFLEAYSTVGGTHHAAMVYGDVTDDLAKFGLMMGWDVSVIG